MSEKTEIYRLNKPLTWKEFLAMPDEYRIAYITALRQKYNVPDRHLCKMMGQQSGGFSQQMQRLRIRSTRKKNVVWDKKGFYAWVNAYRTQKAEPVEDAPICVPYDEETYAQHNIVVDQKEALHPCSGTLCLVGTAQSAWDIIKRILGNKTMKITLSWEAV